MTFRFLEFGVFSQASRLSTEKLIFSGKTLARFTSAVGAEELCRCCADNVARGAPTHY
jgi:hypothetical protein